MSLIVNCTQVSSPSDPLLASDSLLIKWRPVFTSPLPLREPHSFPSLSSDTFRRLWFLGRLCGDPKCEVPLLARESDHEEYLGVHCSRYGSSFFISHSLCRPQLLELSHLSDRRILCPKIVPWRCNLRHPSLSFLQCDLYPSQQHVLGSESSQLCAWHL
jgi:hypothetical protein